MKKTVAIIGAGYAGLAAAVLLQQKGYSVTVYEKNAIPGGRAGKFTKNGFVFDTGPSWYLMPEVFEHFYNVIGRSAAKELQLVKLQPGYRVFFENNEPVTIAGDLQKDAATFASIEKNAGKHLVSYVKKSENLYRLALKHFLYTDFTNPGALFKSEIVKHLPTLLTHIICPLEGYVSHHFSDLRLKQILEYHSVFLGGSPFALPSFYSLMSVLDFKSGVYYPKKGMYTLIENLVNIGKELGVRYYYNTEAAEIIVKNGQAAGITFTDKTSISADSIISNADLHHTETVLLPKPYQTYPEAYWHKRTPGPSALLIMLGLKGRLPQLLHHNLFFTTAWKETFTAIYTQRTIPKHFSYYVSNTNKTDSATAPQKNENLFFLLPLPAGIVLHKEQTAQLARQVLSHFAKQIAEPDFMKRVVVQETIGPADFVKHFHSWEANALGGESHLLRQSALFRTKNTSQKVKNLFYTGASTIPGIGLPMCLISAELVVGAIEKNRQ